MWYKVLLNIFFILGLAILEVSFVSNLPFPFSHANLFLVAIIFVMAAQTLPLSLWWAVGAGFLLDIFSFGNFGIYLILFFLTTIFVYIILNNFFTDRSFYSFIALVFFGSIFFEIFYKALSFFFSIEGSSPIFSKNYLINLFGEILANFVLTFLVYYIFNYLSRRLKPEFLKGKNEYFI